MGPYVDAEWLAERIDDPKIAVVDTRSAPVAAFYAGVGREHYIYGHIPGAVHLDYATELQDPYTSYAVRVAPPERFMEEMGKAGICDGMMVVAYDGGEVPYAARVAWMLHYYGHDAAILAGGLDEWLGAGHPRTGDIPARRMCRFTPKEQLQLRATIEEVLEVAEGRSNAQLLAVWPDSTWTLRTGEIAGARRLSSSELLDETRGCRPANPEKLREATAGLDPNTRTITYCGNGVYAAAAYFALRLAGFSDVAVYDGSWAEWSHFGLPAVPKDKISSLER